MYFGTKMFLNVRYIVILLCLIECQIHQCTGQMTRDVKRSTKKLEEKRSLDFKNNTFIITNFKKSARQKPVKEKENFRKEKSTKKWPKILRQGKGKPPLRFTKMDMFQENNETTKKSQFRDTDEIQPYFFSSYSIKEQLSQLANSIPHVNITLEVIGRTLEYKEIIMLRISELPEPKPAFRADEHKYAEEVPEKKIIFIVHGLSVMGITELPCLINAYSFRILLTYYTSHLDKFDIYLIPLANPDGYSYVLTQRNMIWNKNVSPQSECPGVALDRNFDVSWGNNRSISSCSQEYPGSEPFSEAETRAIRDIFHKYAHKIIAYFNVHAVSYSSTVFRGDAVLYPKGYTDSAVDDDKYIDLRSEIDEAIRNASFQVYSVAVDTLYNWYGRVTGTSVDYASTIYGIPYAMELLMQHYDDGNEYSDTEFYTDLALTEVWRRVIDVIFVNIWKSVHGNDAR